MWASTQDFGAYYISRYVQMPLINFHPDMYSEARRLYFGLSPYQNLYMYFVICKQQRFKRVCAYVPEAK